MKKIKEWVTKKINQTTAFFESWIYLLKILFKRFIEGFRNIDFVIYFLVVIIVVGGLGVFPLVYTAYTEIQSSDPNYIELSKALSTYFITLIATSAADLILNKHPNQKEARSLRMPALSFLIFGGIAIFIVQYNLIPKYSLTISIWSTIGALILWWIANSLDGKYTLDDGQNPANPMGGPNVEIPVDAQEIPNVRM